MTNKSLLAAVHAAVYDTDSTERPAASQEGATPAPPIRAQRLAALSASTDAADARRRRLAELSAARD